MTLWLPKPPDNANSRLHWAVALREKKAFWEQMTTRANAKLGFPAKPPAPLERARYDVLWVAERANWMPDRDNAIRRLKPAIDWLVENDWLVDDTAERLEIGDVHITHRKDYLGRHIKMPTLSTVCLTLTPA